MKLLYLPGLAVLLSALFACTPDQLAEADNLERELLITWVALERNDLNVAKIYNRHTQQSWSASRAAYRATPLTAAQQRSVGLINRWMDNLDFSVRYGQRDNALISLELIQHEIVAVRPLRGQPHPADQLYRFYLDWQEVREVSHDQMMCLLEWNEFEELYELADKQWQDYQSMRSQYADHTVFPGLGMDSYRAEQSAVALNEALTAFGELLAAGDHTLTAQPSDEINRLFIDYLAVAVGYPTAELVE